MRLLPRSFIPRIKLPPLLNKKERFEDVKAPTCFFPTSVVPSIQPDSPFQFDEYDSQGTAGSSVLYLNLLNMVYVKTVSVKNYFYSPVVTGSAVPVSSN
jgi:hypothetical protein